MLLRNFISFYLFTFFLISHFFINSTTSTLLSTATLPLAPPPMDHHPTNNLIHQRFHHHQTVFHQNLTTITLTLPPKHHYTTTTLQIINFGVIFHPGAYCRDLWNILDALVVICALVAFTFRSAHGFQAPVCPAFPCPPIQRMCKLFFNYFAIVALIDKMVV